MLVFRQYRKGSAGLVDDAACGPDKGRVPTFAEPVMAIDAVVARAVDPISHSRRSIRCDMSGSSH